MKKTHEINITFDPMRYIPKRADGVEVFDRGEKYSSFRYILRRKGEIDYMILSEKEKNIWELFDGKRNVHDISILYMKNYSGFIADSICATLEAIWEKGFLKENPYIGNISKKAKDDSFTSKLRAYTHIKIPFTFLSKITFNISKNFSSIMKSYIFWLSMLALVIVFSFLSMGFLLKAKSIYAVLKSDSKISLASIIPIILLLNFLFSCMKSAITSLVLNVMSKEKTTGGLIFFYALPLYYSDMNALPILTFIKRFIVIFSGITLELILAAVAGILIKISFFDSSQINILLILCSLLLYFRVFFAFCPIFASSIPQRLLNFSREKHFFANSMKFFHKHFLSIILGNEPLLKLEIVYIVLSACTLFWFIIAAQLSLTLINNGQQLFMDIMFVFSEKSSVFSLMIMLLFALPFILSFIFSLIFLFSILKNTLAYYRIFDNTTRLTFTGIIFASLVGITAFYLPEILRVQTLSILTLIFSLIGSYIVLRASIHFGKTHKGYFYLSSFIFLIYNTIFFTFRIFNKDLLLLNRNFNKITLIMAVISLSPFFFLALKSFLRNKRLFVNFQSMYYFPLLILIFNIISYSAIISAYLFSTNCNYLFNHDNIAYLLGMYIFSTIFMISFKGMMIADRQIVNQISQPVLITSENRKSATFAFSYVLTQLQELFITHLAFDLKSYLKVSDDSFNKETFLKLLKTMEQFLGVQNTKLLIDRLLKFISWEAIIDFDSQFLTGTQWEGISKIQKEYTKTQRLAFIQKVILFTGLSDEECNKLCECTTLTSYNKDQYVVEQGDVAEAFFLICDGQLQVEIEDKFSNIQIPAFISKGNYFGEMALLKNEIRTASVRAISKAKLLRLYKKDFMALAENNNKIYAKIKAKINNLRFVRNVHFFDDFASDTSNNVISKLKEKRYKKNEFIFKQGDRGDYFYIIKKGKVDVIIEKGSKQIPICTLANGEFFGEIALIEDVARTASIRAKTDLQALCLEKQDLLDVIGKSDFFAATINSTTEKRRNN